MKENIQMETALQKEYRVLTCITYPERLSRKQGVLGSNPSFRCHRSGTHEFKTETLWIGDSCTYIFHLTPTRKVTESSDVLVFPKVLFEAHYYYLLSILLPFVPTAGTCLINALKNEIEKNKSDS